MLKKSGLLTKSAAALALSTQVAFADSSCLKDLAQDKRQYSINLSKALKNTRNLTAIMGSGKVDTMCWYLRSGSDSIRAIDECFKGTREVLQWFDKDTNEQLFGAAEWERIRQRVQEFKTQGTCTGNLRKTMPKNDSI